MDEQGRKPGALEVGLGVAVALAVAALMGLQILVIPRFAEMYREFGAVLPILTRVTLLGAVPVGGAVAALGLGAAGALAARRGAEGQGTGAIGVALLAAGVVVGLGAMGVSLYGLYAPIFELAGKIKP